MYRHLVVLFTLAAALLVMLNAAVLLTPSKQPLSAAATENVTGWAWSSTGGWLSMNDLNPGGGGGSYGVHINPVTKNMNGFAWSSNQGWVCFGSSCGGLTPAGGAPSASVDGASQVRGWANILNLGADGWISLNCADTGGGGSCISSNYKVSVNFMTGVFSGFAWHAVASGTGWGWIDFSGVRMSVAAESNPVTCRDTFDNDLDGQVDCWDTSCNQQPLLGCPANEATQCGLIGQVNCCGNGVDDDFDGRTDCLDDNCTGELACVPENCTNGADDNGNGLIDCGDPQCVGSPSCPGGGPAETICNNGLDDDGDLARDCMDADCAASPICAPAWLKSEFGNIYAKLGVQGYTPPPPGQANATYCITSPQSITNFTSTAMCIESGAGQAQLNLPSGGTGYATNLGRLDVNGILSGRYGAVVQLVSAADLPVDLAGKIYVYDRELRGGVCPSGEDFVLNAKTFNNATGPNARGNGLLVIKGCNLLISGNLGYQSAGVSQYLRNLASFGVLVLAKYVSGVPSNGEVKVDPNVGSAVGVYFAERAFRTGTRGTIDIPLQIYGAVVSRDIRLERRYGSQTQAAEQVTFDGRAVVNPPPGMQDVAKSLPSLKDTF